MSEPTPAPRVVGLEPWLPWPLSASPWWVKPVRAERLAILRIGIAAVLLWDILQNYLPVYDVFYSDQGVLPPQVLIDSGHSPAWAWSLLRGVTDPLTSTLALVAFLGSSALVLVSLGGLLKARADEPAPSSFLRGPLLVWIVSAVVWLLGVWSRLTPPADGTEWLIWGAPALVCGLGLTIGLLLLIHRGIRDRPASGAEFWTTLALLVGLALMAVGIHKWTLVETDPMGPSWLTACFQRFDGNPDVIYWTMLAWTLATVLLLVGLFARVAAVITWLLAVEFIHLNFAIGNAGDVVRAIALFYLMLSPCGAAWSVDAWWSRRIGFGGTVLVPPWPLRLLFVQMTLIYFMNGLYKIVSPDWRDGTILYYVLNDPTLTRLAYAQFPVPLWLLQGAAWLVLTWELGFPLWVAWPRTRKLALAIGILFHLGIFLTMELGAFQLYMLALYLPLLLPRTPVETRPGEEVRLGLEQPAS